MAVYQKVVEELHKPARRRYPRRKFDVRGLDETWQADLVDMQAYFKENKGYRYMLTVIDVFSKYAWAIPVKSKSANEITKAMSEILNKDRRPKNLQVDNGTEFYNSSFINLMKKYNIHLYSTFSNLKASIVERFNRTLKTKMWMQFTLRGNHKWIDIISDLISKYNDTKHRTINIKPIDVSRINEATVLKRFKTNFQLNKKPKFKLGDKVRVSKSKHIFEKGYTPNWTTEIFTIVKVSKTNPVTYHLKDYKDQPISGGFYEQELSKATYPDVYLVEKVIRRRGDRLLIKWLGFPDSESSWVTKGDIHI